MTPSLRTARILTAAAIAATATTIYIGITYNPWLSLAGLYVTAFLAWCAACERRHHHWTLTRHENARRAALLEELDTAVPCCRLAEHSDGRAHGTDCRRPPDLDTVLTAACCEVWLITRGDRHDSTCPTRTTRSNAA